jgi:uncharacterized protein YndB with AHSA1/START domain
MSTTDASTSVRTSIVIEAPAERAFDAFVHEMGSWWNPDHHILEGQLAEMVVEPRVGGHIYDRGVDGSECHWARVLAYDPPRQFVFSWDISPEWKLETDLDKTSEVVVDFISEGPHTTRVELVHRNLDRHGDGWENVHGAIGSPGGWPGGLERFADYVTQLR